MIKNKSGLSAIIVTLIMIVLVLVAVGVIWVVVQNVIQSGTEQIGTGTACLDVDVSATVLTAGVAEGDYDLTLYRSPSGDAIGGVKVVLSSNTTFSSGALEFGVTPTPLNPQQTSTKPVPNTGVVGANKVGVTPYLADGTSCQTRTFDF
jgi:hypothetical protein